MTNPRNDANSIYKPEYDKIRFPVKHSMKKVKVLLFGVGAVGSMIARFLLHKEGVKIVGAVDAAKDKVGKDLGDVLGLDKELGTRVTNDVDAVIRKTRPHIAVHATSSYLKKTYPQIASIVKHGVDVVSTCEELSHPFLTEPKLAKKLDALAKKNDATVLGTGINPGFLMDTLVIALTAPCEEVNEIHAVRVMNAATRRLPFQKKIGAGLTVDEFRREMDRKEITGHVGLEQSIAMISAALGWKLDSIEVAAVEPAIAEKTVQSKDITVKKGYATGLKQTAKGIIKCRAVITLDFQAYIGAEKEYDAVSIKGVPNVNQKIEPCVHGDVGTVAMIVNSIPKVINSRAGLLTMKDMPVPSAALGDMTKHIDWQ
jgi:4-hydroxy-tetrahydrodipicolinate reductase